MAETRLDALRVSVQRLPAIAGAVPAADLTARAYPSEWTIADVLSHLGSGAVISRRRLEDTVAGQATPDDFAQGIWDEWNAKSPEAQRTDSLAADAALLKALEALTPVQRDQFATSMGPMTLDFDAFVGMRLNEHALHTWDIEVAADASATIPPLIAAHVADNLGLIARFTAKPTGDTATIVVATPDAAHGLTVELSPDKAAVTAGAPSTPPDIQLTADALVRLAYGRLDPDHSPAGADGPAVDTLRQVFPGP